MATSEDVRRIALSLPETSEGSLYGTPGFRVRKAAFARPRPEGDALVVWVADDGEKEALLVTQGLYLALDGLDAQYAAPSPRARRSCAPWPTPATAPASTPRDTWKAISGASAPTSHLPNRRSL